MESTADQKIDKRAPAREQHGSRVGRVLSIFVILALAGVGYWGYNALRAQFGERPVTAQQLYQQDMDRLALEKSRLYAEQNAIKLDLDAAERAVIDAQARATKNKAARDTVEQKMIELANRGVSNPAAIAPLSASPK